MNTRTFVLALGLAAAAAAGWWTWQTVRHAHLDLVTLHVRNAPLREVLRRIEKQTGERLVADPRLANPGSTVQLDLDAAPLDLALDRIAEQTGGFWRTLYAVHEAPAAAGRLASVLAQGGDPSATGWTNLSALPAPPPDLEADLGPPGPTPRILRFGGGPPDSGSLPHPPPEILEEARRSGKRLVVVHQDTPSQPHPPELGDNPRPGPVPPGTDTEDDDGGNAGLDVVRLPPPGGRPGPLRMLVRTTGSAAGSDGDLREFDLSPERLLLETRLLPRLPADPAPFLPSAEDAARLADRVKGRWTRLHTLEPAPFPDLPGEVRRVLRSGPTRGEGGASPGRGPVRPPDPAEMLARAEQDLRRRQFDRLDRLTPEQRARQTAARRSAIEATEINPALE
jgi:hypothetical protein